MRKHQEEKDYWEKYKDDSLDLSFKKLEYHETCLDLPSSKEKKEEKKKIKDKKKEKSICKGLEGNKVRALLENKKFIFKPT